MPAGRYKSHTFKRVKKKTPGGRTALRYETRKPSKAVCGVCGKQLHAVPRERPYKMKNLAKTKKRPERPFGGVLCSACLRKQIVKKARV
ncbi:MAG: 50S ribosomal protein L34e [Candidatus Woesearchaeota archaeon]